MATARSSSDSDSAVVVIVDRNPVFLGEGLDGLYDVVIALASEVWVLRERQRALEFELARLGVVADDVIERTTLPFDAAGRAGFIERVFAGIVAKTESVAPTAAWTQAAHSAAPNS